MSRGGRHPPIPVRWCAADGLGVWGDEHRERARLCCGLYVRALALAWDRGCASALAVDRACECVVTGPGAQRTPPPPHTQTFLPTQTCQRGAIRVNKGDNASLARRKHRKHATHGPARKTGRGLCRKLAVQCALHGTGAALPRRTQALHAAKHEPTRNRAVGAAVAGVPPTRRACRSARRRQAAGPSWTSRPCSRPA